MSQNMIHAMQDDDKFGFIVMDGNGCLYGTLTGNHREVLHKFTADLPKKHERGGQSALLFARLRMEKRHNHVRKVAELATHFFISNNVPNVTGVVLAGSADFKAELFDSDLFDSRLKAVVIKTVDTTTGGESGFVQAIEQGGGVELSQLTEPDTTALQPAPPIIFLDINGVICCNYVSRLEEDKLQRLQRLVMATGAKVVLSSSWRSSVASTEQVWNALQRLHVPMMGTTSPSTCRSARPREISQWLNEHNVEGLAPVTRWVAIDDRALLSEEGGDLLRGHFLQTHPVRGLTDAGVDQAIEILLRDPEGVASPASKSPRWPVSR